MGRKLAVDVVWNCFVNTKGKVNSFLIIRGLIITLWCAGEAHTNLPADLHMEHENKDGKIDIEAAKGWFF